MPTLAGLPIVIVTAGASAFAAACPSTAAPLEAAGASVELMQLSDHRVHGYCNGLIFERISALPPNLDWLVRHTEFEA